MTFFHFCLDFFALIGFAGLKLAQTNEAHPKGGQRTHFSKLAFAWVPKKWAENPIFCCPIFVPICISGYIKVKIYNDIFLYESFWTSSILVVHSWKKNSIVSHFLSIIYTQSMELGVRDFSDFFEKIEVFIKSIKMNP